MPLVQLNWPSKYDLLGISKYRILRTIDKYQLLRCNYLKIIM